MRVIKKLEPKAPQMPRRKRTSAYARVSSGKDAMLHSLSAQISYYSDYIQRHGEWEYVGVYADEAATGTKDDRPEFQRLISDCRSGKIDMVITKSIARFARNTVTMLETVRELKLLGIDVYFEKENIHSLSGDGELMLTILASYAQEESRSVSENCKWRIRKMFKEGRSNNGTILGYRMIDGVFYIMPEEADIVRLIFNYYLSGMGKPAIADKLNEQDFCTRRNGRFGTSSIDRILRNEKYTGDMILQKTYIADYISKQKCFNQGELPQYHVEGSHEAIIDKATFEQVQQEVARRAEQYHPSKAKPKRYPFSGILRCGFCGSHFRRKSANAGSKYQKYVWICSTFNSLGKEHCPSRQIPEIILITLTNEVLCISAFDEKVFNFRIAEIQVSAVNQLKFVFHDGQAVQKTWKNPSRSKSWDEAARERQSKIMKRRKRV